MRAADPVVMIGIVAGSIFDRVAGLSWLTRQFAGSTRGLVTNSLIGIAGAFIGFHLAGLVGLARRLSALVIAAGLGAVVVLRLWRMVR
jgi:uncharacterized membrane protein YeaQ/YmgE (transglycosylase-associated protein family)